MCRLTAFGCNTFPAIRTCFVLISSIHKFKAFSILTKHLSCSVAITLCSLWCNHKNSMSLFFLLHNFMDRRFILLGILANLVHDFVPLLIKSRTFTFSLMGSPLWFLFGTSELAASLLVCIGAVIRQNKSYLNPGTVISWQSTW